MSAGFSVSALVIIECNACAATAAPFPSAVLAREAYAEIGWAVNAPGADDVDYCPACAAAAAKAAGEPRRRWS